jgi:hypothetical protein
MDIRGPHDMRGKGVQLGYEQHYMESPPVNVARFLPGPAASMYGETQHQDSIEACGGRERGRAVFYTPIEGIQTSHTQKLPFYTSKQSLCQCGISAFCSPGTTSVAPGTVWLSFSSSLFPSLTISLTLFLSL